MNLSNFYLLYGKWIREAADKYNLDPSLLAGLIMQESAGNPTAKSHCGAYGLTQIMPATAKEKGYDLSSAQKQIFAGADYLNWINVHYAKSDITKLLAGYNAGVGRLRNNRWMRYKETRDYIPRVIKYAEQYRTFVIQHETEEIIDLIEKPRRVREPYWFVNKLFKKNRG